MNHSDIQTFNVESIPVILRSTDAFGDIVAFEWAARGAVTAATKPGAVELLLSTITDGTKSYSKEAIDRILIESGAVHGFGAKSDYIEGSLKCLKRFLPTLLPIFSEMMTHPKLDPQEIEVSRMQIMTQLQNEQVEPDSILQFLSSKQFYKDHPYGNRPIGFLETVPAITRDDLVGLLPKLFNQANIVVAIVGNISPDEARKMVLDTFSALPKGPAIERITQSFKRKPGELQTQKVESPTNYFSARFEAPPLMHPDYPALMMAIQLLDNRLFDEVRTKRALTYAVHAGMGNSAINSGMLYVSSTNLQEAIRVIFQEIRKLQSQPINETTLDRQVRKFTSTWYLSRETAAAQASIFLLYEMIGHGAKDAHTFLERLNKVRPADVQRAAANYLKDFSFTIVGPSPLAESELKDLVF